MENKIVLYFLAVVILIAGIAVWYLVGKIVNYRLLRQERKDAVSKSKSVILWEVYEKIVPLLPEIPFSPKDMVFIGKWVDYIVFDGLSSGDLGKIVFLEVKSGKSSLNRNEKMIRSTINSKKVEYQEFRI